MDDSYKSNKQLFAEIDELKEKLHKAETYIEEFNSMSKQNEASKNQLLSSEEQLKGSNLQLQANEQRALHDSESRYRTLFNESPAPLWEEDFSEVKKGIDSLKKENITDFRNYFGQNPDKVAEFSKLIKILDLNKAVLNLHKANSKDELLQGLTSVFTEDSYNAFKEELIAIASGETECEFEGTVKTLDGIEKSIYLKWSVVPGYEETLEKVYISTMDITEKKHAEEKLKLSEEKFRGVFEQSPVAIEIYNKEGKLIDVNQKTLDVFGVDDKKYILDFDLWADPNLTSEKMTDLKNGKSIFISTDFDFEVVRKHKLYPTTRSGLMYMDMYAIPMMQKNEVTGYLVQIVEVTERKLAEENLRVSEERLKAIIDSSPFPIAVIDVNNNNILHWSISAKQLFGHNPKTSQEWFELAYPDPNYRNDVLDRWKLLLEVAVNSSKAVNSGEYRILCKDGSTKICEIYGQVFHENLILTTNDITEHKKAEQALIESDERFRLAFNQQFQFMAILSPEGRVLEINELPIKIQGGKSEEYIGEFFWKTPTWENSPEWQERIKKQVREVSVMEETLLTEDEFRTDDGEIHTALAAYSAIRDAKNNICYILVQASDITERKEAEELIVKNKNRLEYALTSIETGAWELDLVKKDSWRSFEHDKIFGYPEPLDEWTYEMFLEHVVPEDREMVDEKFKKAISTKTDWNFECRINRKDGSVRWIFGNGNHELNKSKESTKMYGIVQDITERKLAEKELEKYRMNLEELVKERTSEIEKKNEELKEYNTLFVGRELRIKELKDKIKLLEAKKRI